MLWYLSKVAPHFIDETSVIIAICLVIFSMATYADNPGKAYTYAYIRVLCTLLLYFPVPYTVK